MIIGVTGGIASGKSTVARAFAARGIPWVDADEVAREVVAPGEPALAEIAEHFGPEVLTPDGGLDRRALREIVFADAEARQRQLDRFAAVRDALRQDAASTTARLIGELAARP